MAKKKTQKEIIEELLLEIKELRAEVGMFQTLLMPKVNYLHARFIRFDPLMDNKVN